MERLSSNEFSTLDYVEDGDSVVLRKSQPTEPILEEVKQLKGLYTGSHTHGYHVAKVPIVLHFKWQKEWKERHSSKFTWQTYLGMKLNSSEYKNFRVWEGAV